MAPASPDWKVACDVGLAAARARVIPTTPVNSKEDAF